MAGYATTFFDFSSLLFWEDALFYTDGEAPDPAVHLLWTWLCVNCVLQLLQLLPRVHIHYLCFESSRSYDIEEALALVRTVLRSDSWLVNRLLSYAQVLSSLLFLVWVERFLWLTHSEGDSGRSHVARSIPESEVKTQMDSPATALREVVVGMAATCVLELLMRVVVAAAFAISMHDPHVLTEARRQGLTRLDLAVLPTFVYGREDEVTTLDCSICLGAFCIGEMLISLPCDKRHSFHATCIRTWLRQQNSCPLCQKIV